MICNLNSYKSLIHLMPKNNTGFHDCFILLESMLETMTCSDQISLEQFAEYMSHMAAAYLLEPEMEDWIIELSEEEFMASYDNLTKTLMSSFTGIPISMTISQNLKKGLAN